MEQTGEDFSWHCVDFQMRNWSCTMLSPSKKTHREFRWCEPTYSGTSNLKLLTEWHEALR